MKTLTAHRTSVRQLLAENAQLRRALELGEARETQAAIDRANERDAERRRVSALKSLCANYAERVNLLETMLFARHPELRRVYA